MNYKGYKRLSKLKRLGIEIKNVNIDSINYIDNIVENLSFEDDVYSHDSLHVYYNCNIKDEFLICFSYESSHILYDSYNDEIMNHIADILNTKTYLRGSSYELDSPVINFISDLIRDNLPKYL